MKQSIRSFIAIQLNKEIKEELKNIQDELKNLNLDVKWVEINNIHLTLKFLGNVELDDLEKIKSVLKNISLLFKPFEINLSDLSVFPKVDFPRVIWVGLNQGKKELSALTAALEEELKKLGIPAEEREFTPHLTLGRVRSSKNKDKLKTYLNSSTPNFRKSQKIKEITLFQSELKPQGPTYTVLASFFLP
jgi:2'-5' RNA ligase